MKTDAQSQRFASLIEPTITGLGFELVRVQIIGGKGAATAQVLIDRPDGKLSIEDCAQVSRALNPVLEAADPLNSAYRLEISSPGLDRPLTKPADFNRFKDHEVKIETAQPLNGRRNYKGLLQGMAAGAAQIMIDKQVHAIPLEAIAEARLVITDALIKAAQKKVS